MENGLSVARVHFDGSYYVASKYILKNSKNARKGTSVDFKAYLDNDIPKKDKIKGLINPIAYEMGCYRSKDNYSKNDSINEMIKIAFNESINYNILNNDLHDFIYDFIINNFKPDTFEIDKLNNNISIFLNKHFRAIKSRKDRFKLKALNNEWRYFATFTYDNCIFYEYLTGLKWPKNDKGKFIRKWPEGVNYCNKNRDKIEQLFRKKLLKKLQNFRLIDDSFIYMGAFEKGSCTQRLHFHCLINCSSDTFNLKSKKDFNNGLFNEYFYDEKINNIFGRNDFVEVATDFENFKKQYIYISKYIGKDDSYFIYSRGIKQYKYYLSNFDKDTFTLENGSYNFLNICKKEFFENSILLDDNTLKPVVNQAEKKRSSVSPD